jgi:hypothetical protein
MRRVMKQTVCDLDHDRDRPAVVHVVVRSTRVGRPGRPMVRDLMLCAAHAKQLRQIGVDLVG